MQFYPINASAGGLCVSDKQEDDDAVLQIVFFFYQMVFHPATRDFTIKQTSMLVM